jgi:CBS domain-containing protein
MNLMGLIRTRTQVSLDTPVFDAVRTMSENKAGAVAVLDGTKLVGIFTERDVLDRIVLEGKSPTATRVREVMSCPVHTVLGTTSIAEAANVMRERQIRHLAVVDDDGDLLGVLALPFILYDLMGQLETKVDDLETFIMTDGPGG